MSLFAVVLELAALDPPLCLIVFVFGILFPVVKMGLSAYVWYAGKHGSGVISKLTILGRLSMLDIFLLAMIVVGFKGVGIGRIEVRYGAYVYAASVILSVLLSFVLEQELGRKSAHGQSASTS